MVISLIKFFIAAWNQYQSYSKTIARLAYEIEVIEQNWSGGKMDQYLLVLVIQYFLIHYEKLRSLTIK